MLINRKEFIFKTMELFSFLSLGKNIWAEEIPVLKKKVYSHKICFVYQYGRGYESY
jgi:hypothetical protein